MKSAGSRPSAAIAGETPEKDMAAADDDAAEADAPDAVLLELPDEATVLVAEPELKAESVAVATLDDTVCTLVAGCVAVDPDATKLEPTDGLGIDVVSPVPTSADGSATAPGHLSTQARNSNTSASVGLSFKLREFAQFIAHPYPSHIM